MFELANILINRPHRLWDKFTQVCASFKARTPPQAKVADQPANQWDGTCGSMGVAQRGPFPIAIARPGPPRHTSYVQSASAPTKCAHCAFVADRSTRVLRSTTAVRTAAVVSVAPLRRVMSDAVSVTAMRARCRLPGSAYDWQSGCARAPLPPCVFLRATRAPSLHAWGAGGLAEKRGKR